jgi:hypothetical protein
MLKIITFVVINVSHYWNIIWDIDLRDSFAGNRTSFAMFGTLFDSI